MNQESRKILAKSAVPKIKYEKKCSKLCNHGEYVAASKTSRGIRKTKKQLLKEEENIKILNVKIQSIKWFKIFIIFDKIL